MACRGFDDATMLEHALGRLDADESRRVDLHVAHCTECRQLLEHIAPIARALETARGTDDFDVTPATSDHILSVARRQLNGLHPALEPAVASAAAPSSIGVRTPISVTARALPVPAARPTQPAGAWRRWALPLASAVAAGAVLALILWKPAGNPAVDPKDPWTEYDRWAARRGPLSELREPLQRAAAREIVKPDCDLSTVFELEFAGFVCARDRQEPNRRQFVIDALAGVRPKTAGSQPGAHEFWMAAASASAQSGSGDARLDLARSMIGSGRFDDALEQLKPAAGVDARLLRAWCLRAGKSGDWTGAAGELVAAADEQAQRTVTDVRPDHARESLLRSLASVYLWEAGDIDAALRQLRAASLRTNRFWIRAALSYRWGLNNRLKAVAALYKLEDENLLRAQARAAAFSDLPPLLLADDFDSSEDFDSDDQWWRTHYGSADYSIGPEGDGRVLKQTALTDDPADLISKHISRAGNTSLQFDFRFDRTDAGGPPRIGVFGHWSQRERNYRVFLQPDSIQFGKVRPRTDGEIENNLNEKHFVECWAPPPARPGSALQAGVWYTVKFRVEPAEDGRAVRLAVKVWPRNEPEPDAWTASALDTESVSRYPLLPEGRVGLRVQRAAATLDNILLALNS